MGRVINNFTDKHLEKYLDKYSNKIDILRLRPVHNLPFDEVRGAMTSTKNLENIISRGFEIIRVIYWGDHEMANYYTLVYFKAPRSEGTVYYHLFTGFSAGYWGEGCRALSSLLQFMGWSEDYCQDSIPKFISKTSYVFTIPATMYAYDLPSEISSSMIKAYDKKVEKMREA